MTISFTPLRQQDNHYDVVSVPEECGLNLSNANGLDLLDALGIDDACPDEPWPIQYFRTLVTVARRKRLDHLSPAIATTEDKEYGRVIIIHCGRAEGYIELKLEALSNLLNRSIEAGATHIGWG